MEIILITIGVVCVFALLSVLVLKCYVSYKTINVIDLNLGFCKIRMDKLNHVYFV